MHTFARSKLAENLKILRASKNLQRKQLAKELNIEYSTLTNYENGAREPEIAIIMRIADYFDISLDELIGRKRNKSVSMQENFQKGMSAGAEVARILSKETTFHYIEYLQGFAEGFKNSCTEFK